MRVEMSKQPPHAPTASAAGPCPTAIQIVGRPGTGSLPSTIAPPPRVDESRNVQTTPTRTYYKRSRPLPYYNPNCKTPRNWKFTQHHGATRPRRLSSTLGWLVVLGLTALRDSISVYIGPSPIEWEKEERKG